MTTMGRYVTTEDEPVVVGWRVSTRSGSGGGNCVEVGRFADVSGRVAVRDSRDRSGPTLSCERARWDAFVSEVKAGRFDLT